MDLTWFEKANSFIDQYLFNSHTLWNIVFAILFYNVVKQFIVLLLFSRKRKWDSLHFKLLCITVFYWTFASFLHQLSSYYKVGLLSNLKLIEAIYSFRFVSIVFIPALICMHVWRQVHYKKIHWYTSVLYLLVPIFLTTLIIYEFVVSPSTRSYPLVVSSWWGRAIFFAYSLFMLARSYLLLLNVLYQMPPHMRRSSHYMLGALGVTTLAHFSFLSPIVLPFEMINLIGIHILLALFYDAICTSSSNNVIVTSREFVFDNLSTTVLVLNRNQQILDWNKKKRNLVTALPVPKYREKFSEYRTRMLVQGKGRVSPHDNNIITIFENGLEIHYMLTLHEITHDKRKFGYLLEISEVTQLYTIFRYFEEIATIDQLTRLYNRNAYMDKVKKMVAKENMPLLVMVGDVNNLKPLNDIHGHLVGDKLLAAMGDLIKKLVPPEAFVARIGGDEFVVLIANTGANVAETFMEAIVTECKALHPYGGIQPSISWGYSVMTNPDEGYNEVFKKADSMMYATKKKSATFRSSGIIPTHLETTVTPSPIDHPVVTPEPVTNTIPGPLPKDTQDNL